MDFFKSFQKKKKKQTKKTKKKRRANPFISVEFEGISNIYHY